jgi:hypothetical protein
MYAQLTYFDGPRTEEQIAASRRAGLERIEPAIQADNELRDEMVAKYVLASPDGGEIILNIVKTQAALRRVEQVVMSTELLPGEDIGLLPGPDRIETYTVIHHDDYAALAAAQQGEQ